MSQLLAIVRHAPENCPMTNPQTRKLATDLMNKMAEVMRQHQVKLVSSVTSVEEHTEWNVFEAPSVEEFKTAYLDLAPSFEELYTTEIKSVLSAEEGVKLWGQVAGVEGSTIPPELVV